MSGIVVFEKTHLNAVKPQKGEPNAIGYDLTCIDIYKKIGEKTTIYNTHIHIQPPANYYFEIVPRSSLSKTGHIMANSIGIIDPDYIGPLLIPVIKIDENMPDLELPFKLFQLIPRQVHPSFTFIEGPLIETKRGSGGFGSTDKK
jgi:dUTP pyrophosphatase